MYCRKCGKEVQGDKEYCDACTEEMKIVCPYCGKKTNPNAKFCEHCEGYIGNQGTNKTTANAVKQVPQTKMCKSCGKIIPKSAFYCPICNKIADSSPIPTQPQSEPAPNKNTDTDSYAIGFLLGFLIGLIGLIIGLVLQKSEMKRGAIHGFLVQAIVTVVLVGIICCTTCSTMSHVTSIFSRINY
ncbi:MAG: zinc ribbon domain-containing protein [Clostridia bacterium]|nr:zinc ribbon domain-containing protein [Clostridia bacterium]